MNHGTTDPGPDRALKEMWLASIALTVGISVARAVHQRAGGRFTAINDSM
jgi:hypothetical protein